MSTLSIFDQLESRWEARMAQPATGSIAALVVRLGDEAHATPPRLGLSPDGGVHGDRWMANEARDPNAQVSLMDRRVAEILVDGDLDRLHVPGDNIVLDLDLDEASLPIGTRLHLGSAMI